MVKINDGGPAFPVELHATTKDCNGFDGDIVKAGHVATYGGMTLRDYFAAKAMQGFLANPNQDYAPLTSTAMKAVVDGSYQLADAMLAEREKQK